MPEAAGPVIAGRSCPPGFGYSPRVFARSPDFVADTVYVVGGLYGNVLALDAIERLCAHESGSLLLLFNGDFHWFDADPDLFMEIEQRVRAAGSVPLRGNVETQIRAEDASIGCGCAYPDTVPDTEVERSNAITARLREVAGELRRRASVPLLTGPELPMHAVVQVGVARIAVVHGDAWSLAGWGFAHDALHDPTTHAPLLAAFAMAAVDGFACSHTCAPALKQVAGRFVINNGAAGMANFASSAHGICTRLSALPLPRAIAGARLYGTRSAGIGIDALRVDFDVRAWLRRFDAIWPAGSPAAQSYRRRIVAGPAFTVAEALGSPVSVGVCAAAA